jgi:hypothetical protein
MLTALRVARQRTGMSLRDFAGKHSLNETRLCRVERGKEYVPPAWRPILTEALGMSEQDLVDERGFPKLAA